MTKYRLSSSVDNKLDYCANCDVAWLDDGEWGQLDNMGLRMNLGTVFTQPWQRRVREDQVKQLRNLSLQEKFGQDFSRLSEFRSWLLAHPQYAEILAWFGNRDA